MNRLLAALLVFLAVFEINAAASPRTILVLPFENKTSRTDLGWISESFADTVSARLAGNGRTILSRLERDAAYREAGLLPGNPITRASAFKLAAALHADWVVTGTFSAEDGTLRAQALLLIADRLTLAGPLEVTGDLADLVAIQTRLAWRLLAAGDSTFTVGSEEDFSRHFPVLRLDAHENYIRGVLAAEPEKRLNFLLEADRRDPADRRAALEIARHYYELKDYENSAKWLSRLSPSDSGRADVRFLRGVNEFFLGKESAAEKTFAGLARDTPLAEVWNNLGFLQSHLGRWLEATASFDRAYQADPSDPDFSFNLGICMWNVKRYTVALRYLREAVQVAPEDVEVHRLLREAMAVTGDVEGKQKEDRWLEAKGESAVNGGAAAILPNPRLKKQFAWRGYRELIQAGHAGKVAQSGTAAATAEVNP